MIVVNVGSMVYGLDPVDRKVLWERSLRQLLVKRFGLRNPIFSETAAYGHIGRQPGLKEVHGKKYETFTWEKLDYVNALRKEFAISEKAETTVA